MRPGPLRVRIEAEGGTLAAIMAEAAARGLELVREGEKADLVARPAAESGAPEARGPADSTAAAPRLALDGSYDYPHLSGRELEILGYLVDGWSNAEIASVLAIGVRTVRSHLESTYAKLGVARRGEAAREALRLGLVRFEA